MNLEINEEEREFLERICNRAELFCKLNLMKPKSNVYSDFERDLLLIRNLIQKFRELDANLINKMVKNDH